MRKLLTLAIPLLLGVGILTALVSNPDSGKSKQSQAGVAATRSLPAVIEAAAPATPPPTMPAAAPETTTTLAPATTTTAAPATTTTTRPKTTTTTASRPRSTPTTAATAPQPTQAAAQPQVVDCGTGTATAHANLVSGSAPSTNALTATVVNQSTKTIELDSLVVTVDYNDGTQKQFPVQVAGQQVAAQPGQAEVTFPVPGSETASGGPSSIKNFVISAFQFHTAGLPECTSH